jgi:hypothetical protein
MHVIGCLKPPPDQIIGLSGPGTSYLAHVTNNQNGFTVAVEGLTASQKLPHAGAELQIAAMTD